MIELVSKLMDIIHQAQNNNLGVTGEFKFLFRDPDQIVRFKIEGQGKSCAGEIELTTLGADAKIHAHITQIKNKFLVYENKCLFY